MSEFNEVELIDSAKEALELAKKRNQAFNMKTINEYKPRLWLKFTHWLEMNNPFGQYMIVKSVEGYTSAPYSKRTVFFFWYKDCIVTGGSGIIRNKVERDEIENFIKSNFPVQYFLRDRGFALKCKLNRAYDWIRYYLNPRQKWLVKQIPKSWCDKTSLIVDINFAMVVHFIDGEKCFDVVDFDASGDGHSNFAKELKECYEYIKTTRPRLQKEYDASFPENPTGNYGVDYAENNRLEILIDKEDTKWLTWIVINRAYFWT